MHLLLTDVVSCPRCGPEFGLVLLADRIEDRRVLEGWLGCANCRERYRIEGGLADLRALPAERTGVAPAERPEPAPEPGGREEAFRLAALMGVTEGPGFSLVVGSAARLAPGIAELVEALEVVAVDAALAGWPERPGVSRVAAAARLPFHSGSMRAVALTGGAADELLEEGARVLSLSGRLVLLDAPMDAAARLARAGLALVAGGGGSVVAGRA